MGGNNLTKNVEIIGEWFLPNSDKKIPGIFKYNDGQSTLELLRHLDFKESQQPPFHKEIIHGETQRGKVTLTDVVFDNFTGTYGSVYLAIFGRHLDKEKTIESINFNFDLLNEWAVSKYPYSAVSFSDTSLQKYQDSQEKFSFTINDITCQLFISLGTGATHLKGIRTYHLSSFSMKSTEQKSIKDFIEHIIGIQQFLMIVTGRNVNLTSMSTDGKSRQDEVFIPVIKKDNEGSDIEHFFNIGHIRENYTEVMCNWFEFYLKNRYLLSLFFVTMEKRQVEDTDFYVYASMLEGCYKSKHDEEEKYEEEKYEERITDVLSPFKEYFSNLDQFIKGVTKMRHDIFHFNKRGKLDEEKLHSLTHDLFFIIRIILLNNTGIDISMDTNPYMKNLVFLKSKE